MSDNASDIKSSLDDLEKHLVDDKEESVDSANDGDNNDNGGVNENHDVGQVVPNDDDTDDDDELEDGTIFMDAEGNYYYQSGKKAVPVKPLKRNRSLKAEQSPVKKKKLLTKPGYNNDDEADDRNLSTNDKALQKSTLSKMEDPNNSTPESRLSPSKPNNTKIDNYQTTLKIHELSGTERTIVKSDDSDYSDETENDIEEETRRKDTKPKKPLGRYQCMMCPYNVDKKSRLTKHLRKHFDVRPYKCPVCETAFKFKDYLKLHINAHADINEFECTDCDKAFPSSSRLGRHKRLYHSGMKPMKCTECDYSTVCSSTLQHHKSVHQTERPFKCSQCSYSSTNAVKLKAHIINHTEEKPYECDICYSRFREACLLRYHREIHFPHNKKEFKCNRCPAMLRNHRHFRIHMQKLHNALIPNRPHICPHCEQSYTSKACLLRHMEIHSN